MRKSFFLSEKNKKKEQERLVIEEKVYFDRLWCIQMRQKNKKEENDPTEEKDSKSKCKNSIFASYRKTDKEIECHCFAPKQMLLGAIDAQLAKRNIGRTDMRTGGRTV